MQIECLVLQVGKLEIANRKLKRSSGRKVGKEREEKGDDQIRLCSHDAGFGWSKSATAGIHYYRVFSYFLAYYLIFIRSVWR